MASTYYCPNCRASVASGDRFCSNCGVNLKRVAEQALGIPPLSDDCHYLHEPPNSSVHGFNNQQSGWYIQAGCGSHIPDGQVRVMKKAEQYQKDNIHDHPLPEELKRPIRTEIMKLLSDLLNNQNEHN